MFSTNSKTRLFRFQNLPKNIREYLLDEQLQKIMEGSIFDVFRLDDNKIHDLNYIILSVFLGQLNPQKIVNAISELLGSEQSTAQQITSKLHEFVFAKYKGFIRDLYSGEKSFEEVVAEYKALEQ